LNNFTKVKILIRDVINVSFKSNNQTAVAYKSELRDLYEVF